MARPPALLSGLSPDLPRDVDFDLTQPGVVRVHVEGDAERPRLPDDQGIRERILPVRRYFESGG
jgi:hypothetical protein